MVGSAEAVWFENRHTIKDEKAALQDDRERTRPDDGLVMAG